MGGLSSPILRELIYFHPYGEIESAPSGKTLYLVLFQLIKI
jgi:hypothetical protein